MKKEVLNKKILLLSLFVLSVFIINIILISAQSEEPSLIQRWMDSALNQSDAKWLIFIMTAVVIYVLLVIADMSGGLALLISVPAGFVLTAFVTPDSVLGIIRSYNTLPLTIATILPLGVLFLATYLALIKGNRSLMTFAWLFWIVYFVYNLAIWLVYLNNTGYLPWGRWAHLDGNVLAQMVNYPEIGTSEGAASAAEVGYFWTALMIRIIISGIMSFWYGGLMNYAMYKTLGLKKAVFQEKLNEMDAGVDTLLKLGKKMEGGGSVTSKV